MSANRISACLWFDTNAEEAVDFYLSVAATAAIFRI
jgi:predicted 3-demethylubiquinone-9 3-methyltransferase (glyoxalase superfamily)